MAARWALRAPRIHHHESGRWAPVKFASAFGTFRHPQEGWILYDTGYGPAFKEATRPFPERLYAWMTPVTCAKGDTAACQLKGQGVDASAVKWIIVSHFHGDHIAALKEFPNARFLCFGSAYQKLLSDSRLKNLLQGVLPGLLPADFAQRLVDIEALTVSSLEEHWRPFERGYDIFNDGSMLIVPLQGHAHGHAGLIFKSTQDRSIFLVGDAVWHSRSIRELKLPHPVTRLITADAREYRETVQKLHQLHLKNPDALLVPSHCPEF